MRQDPAITVIGSIVADVIIHREDGSPYKAPEDPGLVCEGDKKFAAPESSATAAYLQYAYKLESTLSNDMREKYPVVHRYGGPALATAYILHQLGARVRLIGAVGDDGLGRGLTDFLGENDMDVGGIRIVKGVHTSTNLIFENRGGTAYNLAVKGANEYLETRHVSAEDLKASVVQLSGIALNPGFMDGAAAVIDRAHQAGAKVGWDTAVDLYGKERSPEAKAAMSKLDFMTPSMGEAPGISGLAMPEENLKYFSGTLGIPAVFLKNGKDGMDVSTAKKGIFGKDALYHRPVMKGIRVRGETGAGDSAVAGIVFAIAKGLSSEEAAMFGIVCGSLTCENREGMVTNIGRDPKPSFAAKLAEFKRQLAV